MPGPGDRDDQDDDDLIGFVSPASLQGTPRQPPEPQAPTSAPEPRRDEVLRPAFPERPPPIRQTVAASVGGGFASRPAPSEAPPRSREHGASADSFTLVVYALILMTVPTLGVAGLIALLAVRGRAAPSDPTARSHFIYQTRTLQAGGIAAIVGVVLLAAPFALGVTLLFGLALWLLLRGAAGVWKLKAGRAIADPMSWWI